jgi:hypothetical protein
MNDSKAEMNEFFASEAIKHGVELGCAQYADVPGELLRRIFQESPDFAIPRPAMPEERWPYYIFTYRIKLGHWKLDDDGIASKVYGEDYYPELIGFKLKSTDDGISEDRPV